jgi:hypothetical protein
LSLSLATHVFVTIFFFDSFFVAIPFITPLQF